jgi:fluoroquinolone transport system ATP-binding protein
MSARVIEVDQLTYTYANSPRPAVQGLTFSVAQGEILGFLGPSGAGKSTTQKVLTGLLRGFEGTVTVLGQDISRWGADLYEQIGVSFEHPNHFSRLTAQENLAYFARLYAGPTRSPESLLALVGLENDGGTQVAHFSKGMKSRLTVARALLHSPTLLFLDEPTAGLDPGNSHLIQELIRCEQQAGHTIFLTTHDMHVAESLCDRVAFIVDGQLRLIAPPRQLKLEQGRPTVRIDYRNGGSVRSHEFPLSGLADNQRFLELLRTYPIETMHSQEATLDEIFMAVTGQKLR